MQRARERGKPAGESLKGRGRGKKRPFATSERQEIRMRRREEFTVPLFSFGNRRKGTNSGVGTASQHPKGSAPLDGNAFGFGAVVRLDVKAALQHPKRFLMHPVPFDANVFGFDVVAGPRSLARPIGRFYDRFVILDQSTQHFLIRRKTGLAFDFAQTPEGFVIPGSMGSQGANTLGEQVNRLGQLFVNLLEKVVERFEVFSRNVPVKVLGFQLQAWLVASKTESFSTTSSRCSCFIMIWVEGDWLELTRLAFAHFPIQGSAFPARNRGR